MVVPGIGRVRAAVSDLLQRDVAVRAGAAGNDDRSGNQPDHHASAGEPECARGSIGDTRYPNVATLDLNLRKVFKMPNQRHSLSTRLEIFNATNQSTITAWVTQLGPTYHQPSGLQRGRLIKMELAYEF